MYKILALHLAITLPLAYLLNIWVDEASTLYTTQNGFAAAFRDAADNEKQAPLYFWILSLWCLIDSSIFFARLFSIGCSLIAIRFFAVLMQRFFENRTALILTAFFAIHPFLIWASLEIRVYAMVIMLSLILIELFLRAFVDESKSSLILRQEIISKALFFFVAVLSLYTNYYLGFLLLGLFFALVTLKRWRQALEYLAVMAVVAVAFLPMIFQIAAQFAVNTRGYTPNVSLIEGIQILWHHAVNYVLPVSIQPDTDEPLIRLIRAWIVRSFAVVFLIFALINRKQISSQTFAFTLMLAAVSFCFLIAYLLLGSQYVEHRHSAVLFAPFFVVLFLWLKDLNVLTKSGAVKVFCRAFVVILLASVVYSTAALYSDPVKRGDWASVAEFVGQHESPGQPIVIYDAYESLALPFHYDGVNKIYPNSRYFDFDTEAEYGTHASNSKQIEFVISQVPPEAETVWLIVNELCLTTEACIPLENFVHANYTIDIERDFYRSKVFRLKRHNR